MDPTSNATTPLSPTDLDWMTKTVAGEADGDPSAAAVAHVILNRLNSGNFGGDTIPQVVLAKGQFTSWRDHGRDLSKLTPSDPRYQRNAKIVNDVVSGAIPDPTGGAVNYYNPELQASGYAGQPPLPPPAFAKGPGQQIGAHVFFGGNQNTAVLAQNGLPSASDGEALWSSLNGKTPAPAPTSNPGMPTADQGEALWGALRAPVKQASPPPNLPAKGSYTVNGMTFRPDDPIPAGSPSATTIDPYDPITKQIGTAINQTGNYALGQIQGIPGAIAQDFSNASAVNALGNQRIQSGQELPTFPSANPATWGAGGILPAAAGIAGQVFSPITGAVRQLVQDPVTQATGSPAIGEGAGMVANTVLGGLVPRTAGLGANALTNAAVGSMDPETAFLASTARNTYGIPINAMQMSESPGVRLGVSAIDRLPFSGAGKDVDAQHSAFNRAVSQTIGENAERLTPDVMTAARTRIGGYYNQVAANTNLNVDSQFLQDVHDALNHASQVLPKDSVEPLIRQAQNIVSKIDPNTKTISGATYQALTNQGAPLDKLMDSSDPTVGFYANGLKKALDGALSRSATPEDQQLLKTADKQWWALKTIQPIVAKAPTGDISPALLAGRVNASTGNGMAFGSGGDLGTLARIGQRFLKEPQSSGTSERLAAQLALYRTGGALGAAAVGAHEAGILPAMTPESMLATAVGLPSSLIAGRAVGSALRSNWLANSLINKSLGYVPPPAGFAPRIGAANALTGALNPPVNALAAPNP